MTSARWRWKRWTRREAVFRKPLDVASFLPLLMASEEV